MTRTTDSERSVQSSRRSILRAGGAATVASLLGFSGSTVAQQDGSQDGMGGWMFNDEVRPGAVFRVKSQPLENTPNLGEDAVNTLPENPTTRIVEYFNTQEEATLLLPSDSGVEEGELYQLSETLEFATDAGSEGLMRVQFQRLSDQDFPFDLASSDEVQIIDGGGEGAVRPRNFSAGSIFRVTSGPQGWVPDDVRQSGLFTAYNTRHAEYLGTNDEFLFFPQQDADVETDALYTVESEWELLDPAGNLVAVEFSRVAEDSIPVDDQYL